MFERMDEVGRIGLEVLVEDAFEDVEWARGRMERHLREMAEWAADPQRVGWIEPRNPDPVSEYQKVRTILQVVVKTYHAAMYAVGGRDEAKAWLAAIEARVAEKFHPAEDGGNR